MGDQDLELGVIWLSMVTRASGLMRSYRSRTSVASSRVNPGWIMGFL